MYIAKQKYKQVLESEIKIKLKLALSKKLDYPPYIYYSTNQLFGVYFIQYSFEFLPEILRAPSDTPSSVAACTSSVAACTLSVAAVLRL